MNDFLNFMRNLFHGHFRLALAVIYGLWVIFVLFVHPEVSCEIVHTEGTASAINIFGLPILSKEWLAVRKIADFERLVGFIEYAWKFVRVGLAVMPAIFLAFMVVVRKCWRLVERFDSTLLFVLIATVVILCAQADPVLVPSPKLDPSWQWALNKYAFKGSFGSLFSFTYGPLGFLLYPQLGVLNVVLALTINVLFSLCWILVWLDVRKNTGKIGRLSSWCALLIFVFPHDSMECVWMNVALLCAVWPLCRMLLQSDCLSKWIFIASPIVAFLLFVKSSAVTLFLSYLASLCVLIVIRHRQLGRLRSAAFEGVVALGLFLLTYASIAVVCFNSSSDYILWLKGSSATATAYNLHMVSYKSWAELLCPVIILSLFSLLLLKGQMRRIAVVAFAMSPFLYGLIKYAWCRQTFLSLFSTCAGVVCLILIFTSCENVRRWSYLCGLNLLLVFACPYLNIMDLADFSRVHWPLGLNVCHAARTLLVPIAFSSAKEKVLVNVSESRLSEAWRKKIGNHSMTQLPYSFGVAMSDDSLLFRPLKSLQLYAGCCSYFDGLNAEFFSAPDAPEYIVCDLDVEWCGHFVNYPKTWKAILSRYEYDDGEHHRVLLHKRTKKLLLPEGDLPVGIVQQTNFGKTAALLTRNTIASLTVKRPDGKCISFQTIPENLNESFPCQCIPFDEEEMRNVLRGHYWDGNGVTCQINFESVGYYTVNGAVR